MATSENWLSRRKGRTGGDLYKLDTVNKTPEENIIDIFQGLYLKKLVQNDVSPTSKFPNDYKPISMFRNAQRGGTDSYRLSYLNSLVTILCKTDRNNLGFTIDELMTCIRVSLVDESMVIRAAALRVLRYLIKTEADVATFNNLKLPYLVVRSMDLMLPNEEERAQALRVVRRVIAVCGRGSRERRHRAAYVEPGLLRCLAAVARAGSAADGAGDRLSRPAVATLAEICVLNSELFILCGGVTAVTRQLAECATPRMSEALCGVLLHTLNEPTSRLAARIDLTSLSAPYCDFYVRPSGTDTTRDEREMRFTCSRLALVCVLRSWPGLLHFCHPAAPGGLRALVVALYPPRLELRKAILDLLYELVGLPQPEWTDEISVAINAVDPSDLQDSWRLNEGFVATEGIAILPHLSATGPDITEIHLALLLQCFLEAGLLDGLAEVIVTSDTFISVRATVLLGQLMHLIHLLLPPQICNVTPALPTLMSQASSGKPQALAAIAALKRLHSMLESRPASNTLFLDHIIQYCSGAFIDKDTYVKSQPILPLYKDNSIEFLNESDNENEPRQRHSIGSRADVPNRNVSVLVKSKSVSLRTSAARVTKSTKFFSLFEKDSDHLIRSSLVMQNKDGNTWDWDVIRTILKENDSNPYLNLNDSSHKTWAARVVSYLKPSSNKFSHTDLSSTCHGYSATRAGCQLIRHLLKHNDVDSQRLLEELFTDVSRQIEAIETGRRAHECLFGPQHMGTTMCQMYFLFIGQLCHSQDGLNLFYQTRLYDNLLELSTNTHHSCYVKLIISSLDYTLDSYPRDILTKTLTCSIQASRLYTTQFLNVLIRASHKSRELVRRKAKIKSIYTQENVKLHKENAENELDMDTWLLQALVGQVKDECKAIVKCALTILEEAASVPAYLDKLSSMKDALCQNCHLDKSADPASLDLPPGVDRGYLLWLSLEVHSSSQPNQEQIRFLKKHLDYWTRFYNYRYVRLVESCVQEALALCEAGRGTARARRSARPATHLHAALVRVHTQASTHAHTLAATLLSAVLPAHYKILQRKSCTTEQDIMELKASLWALGHTAASLPGLQLLMNLSNGYLEDSVPVHIVRLAKYCPVYSVRATAFYVLGLIGSTFDGANLLAELGWLCVRHSRNEQFPIIQDEIFPNTDHVELQCPVTSPDRRFAVFDTETSEHSDHTDMSVAESLPSDNSKILIKENQEKCQKDQDVTDNISNTLNDKRKSHTLPSQPSIVHDRPLLSESKTVDIIKDYNFEGTRVPILENRLLIARMNSLDHTHEGRVRNTSESSTSGVSSCDSFLGKYAIPDRVLTLSPIPSSSSLYGMKSAGSSQRQRVSESQRRVSTSSFTTPEVTSSPPTQMDMNGYATWKALNTHRRPHLSESAASGSSEIDDITWLLTDTSKRSKGFSSLRDRARSTRERIAKLSLLEYDWRPLPVAEGARAAPTPPPARLAPRAFPSHARQHYRGVCLPRRLRDLFPREDEGKEVECSENKVDASRRGCAASFMGDSSTTSVDKSRATPDNTKVHHRGGSSITITGIGATKPHSTTEEGVPATNVDTMTATASTSVNVAGANKTASVPGVSGAEGERSVAEGGGAWRHSVSECIACVRVRVRPPSAHELREAFFAGVEPPSTTTIPPEGEQEDAGGGATTSPHARLLRHARFMCNPIHFRQTRSAIISLKQLHPEVFRSPCLYSDVSALLARDTYMLCARRFLQDQFLDVNFDTFLPEVSKVLERHSTVTETQ